jgi:hypothetical protein
MKLDRNREKRKHIDGMPQSFKMALAVRIARRLFSFLCSVQVESTPAVDSIEQAISSMESFCRDPATVTSQVLLAGEEKAPDMDHLIRHIAEKRAQGDAAPATAESSILVVDFAKYDGIAGALSAALRVWEIERARIFQRGKFSTGDLRDYVKQQAFATVDMKHRQLTTDTVLYAWDTAVAADPRMEDHLWKDLEASHHVLNTARIWRVSDSVPEYLYLIPSEFDLTTEPSRSAIREIVRVIDEKLVAYFRKHPNRIKELSWRQFEELICEVVDGFGWEAKLTSQTVDGGYDIVAIDHSPPMPKNKYLIECKRYTKKPVGIKAVHALNSVTMLKKATKGILVTTSDFSKPARKLLDEHEWQLEGRNFYGLLEWLERYQQLKMSQDLIR